VIEIVTKKRLIDLDTPTAAETNKRAKTAANANAAAAAVPVVSKRRAVNANQLVKEETDDGIPVELRMLMGASGTTSTTSSATAAVGVMSEASAGEMKKVTMPGTDERVFLCYTIVFLLLLLYFLLLQLSSLVNIISNLFD